MKLELSITEAAMLIDTIQSLPSVKQEAPEVSSWEPKFGEKILVSDDGEDWRVRIFKCFNEDGKLVAELPEEGRPYSWEMMMPYDRSAIR